MDLQTQVLLNDISYVADLRRPLDISIKLAANQDFGAWYIEPPRIYPVEIEGFVGSIAWGGSTNFKMIEFNPHAHTTHTECLGHITEEPYSVSDCIQAGFKSAGLISIIPEERGADRCIEVDQIKKAMSSLPEGLDALVIRTLPNDSGKLAVNYSNTNPAYIQAEAMRFIVEQGIEHLLVDLPSVDKEKDEGALLAHKIFWGLIEPEASLRKQASITELVYVDSSIEDGLYLLDLVFMQIDNDAAPSRPILYKLEQSL